MSGEWGILLLIVGAGLLGWLLFNVAFALGMYFRPVRKQSLGSANSLTLQKGADVRPEPSEAREASLTKWEPGAAPHSRG